MTDDTGRKSKAETVSSSSFSSRSQSPSVMEWMASPAVKFVLIGLLTLGLLIPSVFVWGLVEERADRAKKVARDIARSWGASQTVNGPYLVVPYTETFVTTNTEGVSSERSSKHYAVFFPKALDIHAEVTAEERRKSIYSLPVYRSVVRLNGRFAKPEDALIVPEHLDGKVVFDPADAFLITGIGDIRALKSDVTLVLNGSQKVAFEPGLAALRGNVSRHRSDGRISSGISVPVSVREWRKGFAFEISLELNGSSSLSLAPSGQTTKVKLTSNWPHPGFTGAFLPDQRSISNTGFEATWTIPYLARGIANVVQTDQLPLQDKQLGVKFVEPVNFYQTIARSLKYAVGFISLTFLAVFVLELRSGWRLHWIQYALVGFSLIVFYVMLLAFAEHIGYGPAYLIAAGAATVLNAVYVGTSLRSRMAGVILFAVLASTFGILFALMREQDYALLIGSVVGFAALAVTMFVTQKIDWTGAGQSLPGPGSRTG